jgi:hypothetical protein
MSRDAGLADVFHSGLVRAAAAVVLQESLVIVMDHANMGCHQSRQCQVQDTQQCSCAPTAVTDARLSFNIL